MNSLVFAYVVYNKCKIYRPEESPDFKWRNSCPGHYIQGMEQLKKLPKRSKLIITKSLKDVMVFFTFLGNEYHIIAPQSESYIFTDKMLQMLLQLYERVVVVYDYDLAGVTAANKLRKRSSKIEVKFVSTKRMSLNGKMKVIDKDISDFSVMRQPEEIYLKLKEMDLC
jgi:hypothetical protein